MESHFSPFPKATALAHRLIRQHLELGKIALDATVGNGHDTLFLANLVGETGRVFGFDIQAQAIESTRQRLEESGKENVTLFHTGHQMIAEKISEPIDAAMFNLGYLPSGDKKLITEANTTIQALDGCCQLGAKIITVVIYPGHDGGKYEADAVVEWGTNLDQEIFAVIQYGFLNQQNDPPFLIAIERT